MRQEIIKVCRAILPEEKAKLTDVIDTVHRLGTRRQGDSMPRGFILQFTSRFYKDATWKAAKKSTFVHDNNLRFAEDLSKADRERREKLWPAVGKDEKTAYFIGGRAFINGSEINLPP